MGLAPSKSPGFRKGGLFKEVRVKFVIFAEMILSMYNYFLYVSSNLERETCA